MRYGTVPIVRHTPAAWPTRLSTANPSTIRSGAKPPASLLALTMPAPCKPALRRALRLYREDKELWAKLVDNVMAQDFSWDHSAREYEKLMQRMTK